MPTPAAFLLVSIEEGERSFDLEVMRGASAAGRLLIELPFLPMDLPLPSWPVRSGCSATNANRSMVPAAPPMT